MAGRNERQVRQALSVVECEPFARREPRPATQIAELVIPAEELGRPNVSVRRGRLRMFLHSW
jgi:hypothetical protein